MAIMRSGVLTIVLTAATLVIAGELEATRALEAATPISATATVAAPSTIEPTAELPTAAATPLPATPTPQLPEEGGPAGGILSGHLYVDSDHSGGFSPGDGPVAGAVFVDQLDAGSGVITNTASSDAQTGAWELRALPDGTYRIRWSPPVPESLLGETIPPAESVVLNPNQTVVQPVVVAVIAGGRRVSNIDFGIPAKDPVAGDGVTLPKTGAGASGKPPLSTWLLLASLAAALATAVGIAITRTPE